MNRCATASAVPRRMPVPSGYRLARAGFLSLCILAGLAACDRAPPASDAAASPGAAVPAQAYADREPEPQAVAASAGTLRHRPAAAPTAAPGPIGGVAAQAPVRYADYRPPLAQPAPIAVRWAPPPLQAEAVPPAPAPEAYWVGGYWMWDDGGWAWAPGRWEPPPRPRYRWIPPYYEHLPDRVVFVNGFWAAPPVRFAPPPPALAMALVVIATPFAGGVLPQGPLGVFLPPPPGSRPGLIVPAPVGMAPVVLLGAPPVAAPGMRVTVADRIDRHDTTIDRTTVIQDNRRVIIQAPAEATAGRRAVDLALPASAPHPAAAQAAPPSALPVGAPSPQRSLVAAAPTAPAAGPALAATRAAVPAHADGIAPMHGPARAAALLSPHAPSPGAPARPQRAAQDGSAHAFAPAPRAGSDPGPGPAPSGGRAEAVPSRVEAGSAPHPSDRPLRPASASASASASAELSAARASPAADRAARAAEHAAPRSVPVEESFFPSVATRSPMRTPSEPEHAFHPAAVPSDPAGARHPQAAMPASTSAVQARAPGFRSPESRPQEPAHPVPQQHAASPAQPPHGEAHHGGDPRRH